MPIIFSFYLTFAVLVSCIWCWVLIQIKQKGGEREKNPGQILSVLQVTLVKEAFFTFSNEPHVRGHKMSQR